MNQFLLVPRFCTGDVQKCSNKAARPGIAAQPLHLRCAHLLAGCWSRVVAVTRAVSLMKPLLYLTDTTFSNSLAALSRSLATPDIWNENNMYVCRNCHTDEDKDCHAVCCYHPRAATIIDEQIMLLNSYTCTCTCCCFRKGIRDSNRYRCSTCNFAHCKVQHHMFTINVDVAWTSECQCSSLQSTCLWTGRPTWWIQPHWNANVSSAYTRLMPW